MFPFFSLMHDFIQSEFFIRPSLSIFFGSSCKVTGWGFVRLQIPFFLSTCDTGQLEKKPTGFFWIKV